MITIGFCNLKGGVGKTTACQNIAVAVSKMGRKVAVVDMDPQSNLSAGFGFSLSPTDPQVFDLLSGGASWDDILRQKEGIDIIPSSLNLALAEMNNEGPVSRDDALRDAVSKVDPDRYDYIFVDSPPQLGVFTRNVLSACSKIVVPMDGGYYSLFGLRLLNDSMPEFHKRLNPEIEITGILMTNYSPRLYISHQVYEGVKKSFGGLLMENYVRQNISLVEASSMGMSIFAYAPKSTGAKCYKDVAVELLGRLEGGIALPRIVIPEPPKPEPAPKPAKPEHKTPAPEAKPAPKPAPTPTPKPEPKREEAAPAAVQEVLQPVKNYGPSVAGDYEEGIKQDIIDMLPENEKALWIQMLAPITDISRAEMDVRALREEFETADKNRFTFYILNDEEDTLWPVMYPDQIAEPMKCLIKWDENGSAEVYM